jgi:hypothetical protein
MNLYLMLVAKNESERYLKEFIEYHSFFDDYFLYDDRSDDDTVEIAERAGWKTVIRDSSHPSFMEHEGKFRFNSWKSFENTVRPGIGDWVLSIDADEFIISNSELSVQDELRHSIEEAQKKLIIMFRREIWKLDNTGCYMRTDGYWKDDRLYRLFKYRPNANWSNKPMGCGSAPSYVGRDGILSSSLEVLHFGYTNEEDRQERYQRYTGLANHGHNEAHIQSIPVQPKLMPYAGPLPEWTKKRVENWEES